MHFGGDLNLCRAYMPYKCNQVDGKWIVPETGQEWTPTDVHSATTDKALELMGIDKDQLSEKDYKKWRSIGKMFNFMRNYGGGDKKASEALEISLDEARAMNKGYTDSFPKVVAYQKAVEQTMLKQGYVENLLGRRYYLSNPNRFYKVGNYLIQGSCADILKKKMLEISKFIKDNKLETRMILCVHDELQFRVHPQEDWIIPSLKKIMEDTPEIQIPIIAEIEFTETNWADKKEWHG
jgi:DNA polymerase-1